MFWIVAVVLPSLVASLARLQCSCSKYLPCARENRIQKTFPECMEHCLEKHSVSLPPEYISCLDHFSPQLTDTIDCIFKEVGLGCTSSEPKPAQVRPIEKFQKAIRELLYPYIDHLGYKLEFYDPEVEKTNKCMLRCFHPGRNICSISMKCALLMPNATDMADILFYCGESSGLRGSAILKLGGCMGHILKQKDVEEEEEEEALSTVENQEGTDPSDEETQSLTKDETPSPLPSVVPADGYATPLAETTKKWTHPPPDSPATWKFFKTTEKIPAESASFVGLGPTANGETPGVVTFPAGSNEADNFLPAESTTSAASSKNPNSNKEAPPDILRTGQAQESSGPSSSKGQKSETAAIATLPQSVTTAQTPLATIPIRTVDNSPEKAPEAVITRLESVTTTQQPTLAPQEIIFPSRLSSYPSLTIAPPTTNMKTAETSEKRKEVTTTETLPTATIHYSMPVGDVGSIGVYPLPPMGHGKTPLEISTTVAPLSPAPVAHPAYPIYQNVITFPPSPSA